MSDQDRIKGKVAAVLSKRELVLNLGSADGVVEGMRFVILNSKGVDVRDPDTGEILGSVEVPKTLVKIVRVDGPRISVGRTFRTIRGRAGFFSAAGMLAGEPDRVETLDIEAGSSVKAELPDNESYVRKGDTALETVGDEYDDLA